MPARPTSSGTEWLHSKGVTQRDLSRCTGLSQTRLHRQLSGSELMSNDLRIALRTLIASTGKSGPAIDGEMYSVEELCLTPEQRPKDIQLSKGGDNVRQTKQRSG